MQFVNKVHIHRKDLPPVVKVLFAPNAEGYYEIFCRDSQEVTVLGAYCIYSSWIIKFDMLNKVYKMNSK
jgi:hypothetical protein